MVNAHAKLANLKGTCHNIYFYMYIIKLSNDWILAEIDVSTVTSVGARKTLRAVSKTRKHKE